MSIKIETTRCKNPECDTRGKHFHANFFSESCGIIVDIGNPETFHSYSECKEYCENMVKAGCEWENKIEKK